MLFLDLCCFYSNTVSNTYFTVMNFNKVTRLGFLGRRAAQWKLRYTVWSPAAGSSQWKPTVYVTSAGHLVKGLLSHMSSPHVCFNGSESHWPAMFIWSEREKDAGCFQHQLFKRILILPISFHWQNTPYSSSWLHAACKQWIMSSKTMYMDLRERRSMTPSTAHSQGWSEEPRNGTHRHDCLRQYWSLMHWLQLSMGDWKECSGCNISLGPLKMFEA